jgi:hypothetical protein
VDVRRVAHEEPRAEHRGAHTLADLLGGQLLEFVSHPELLGERHRRTPPALVRRRRRDGEIAAHPEPGIDLVGLAPGADLRGAPAGVHQ